MTILLQTSFFGSPFQVLQEVKSEKWKVKKWEVRERGGPQIRCLPCCGRHLPWCCHLPMPPPPPPPPGCRHLPLQYSVAMIQSGATDEQQYKNGGDIGPANLTTLQHWSLSIKISLPIIFGLLITILNEYMTFLLRCQPQGPQQWRTHAVFEAMEERSVWEVFPQSI